MGKIADLLRMADVIDGFVASLTGDGGAFGTMSKYAIDDEVLHTGHGDPFLNEMAILCGRALSRSAPDGNYSAEGLAELRDISRRIRAKAATMGMERD